MMSLQSGRGRWVIVAAVAVLVLSSAIWYSLRGTSRTAKATTSEAPRPVATLPGRVVLDASGLVETLPDLTAVLQAAIASGVVRPTDHMWQEICTTDPHDESCTFDHSALSAPRVLMVQAQTEPSAVESRTEFTFQRQHLPVYAGKATGAVEAIRSLGDESFATRYGTQSFPLGLRNVQGVLLVARLRNVVLDVRLMGPDLSRNGARSWPTSVPVLAYSQAKQEAIAVMRLLIAQLAR